MAHPAIIARQQLERDMMYEYAFLDNQYHHYTQRHLPPCQGTYQQRVAWLFSNLETCRALVKDAETASKTYNRVYTVPSPIKHPKWKGTQVVVLN